MSGDVPSSILICLGFFNHLVGSWRYLTINGEINEQLAPESMRAWMGSAVGLSIVTCVCSSGDVVFLLEAAIQQIVSILRSIRGMQLAVVGSPTLFPTPLQIPPGVLRLFWQFPPFSFLCLTFDPFSTHWDIP